MKLRLIQLTGLFAFVVAILMLAPPDEGIGGAPSSHVPSIWINGDPANSDAPDYGRPKTPDNPGIHLIGEDEDPRGKSFNEMCGTNGEESVSGFAWYYRGGKVSDSDGHQAEHDIDDPNVNTNSDTHLTTFKQNIYTLYLNGYASTSANEASGSLDPGISEAESIELSAAHQQEPFHGQGKITLEIEKTDYHIPQYEHTHDAYYIGCKTQTSDEYYFRPVSESVIKVIVHIKNVKEKRKGSISGSINAKGASSSFTHEWEWEKGWFWTKGRGFGMKASVGGSWDAFWKPEIKLQKKTAVVNGNIENAGLPTLNAEYAKRKSWCPPDSSGTSEAYVPHLYCGM